jgi:hypothetical protein
MLAGDQQQTRLAVLTNGSIASITTPATFDVVIGGAALLPFNLDGADGFRYDVLTDGELFDGGTADRRLTDAWDGAYRLRVNGGSFGGAVFALFEAGSRQLVIGPQAVNGFQVTRKVFVPADGGFARFLELLQNPDGTNRSATVRIDLDLGSNAKTRIVVPPSATTNRYAVTDDALTGLPSDPTLGHVFGGPGATIAVSTNFFADANDKPFYQWNLTVPAGQMVALMHFALQREPGDTNAARIQAEGLMGLTAANELSGLSPAERALILNFNAAVIASSGQLRSNFILLTASQFVADRMQFDVLAADGSTCVIEASADLIHWEPVSTNIIGGGSITVTDPESLHLPQRYYRAVWLTPGAPLR